MEWASLIVIENSAYGLGNSRAPRAGRIGCERRRIRRPHNDCHRCCRIISRQALRLLGLLMLEHGLFDLPQAVKPCAAIPTLAWPSTPPIRAWPDRGGNGCRNSDGARRGILPRSPSRTHPACPRSRGQSVLFKDRAHALALVISRWTSSLVAEIRASANHTRFWVSSLTT